MCGIVGYVGGREACPILLKGLHRLEYRGYDSAGVAMVDEDLHEWDVCAANLIVREAGGVVADFRPDRGVSQAAGNETLVREILKYVI